MAAVDKLRTAQAQAAGRAVVLDVSKARRRPRGNRTDRGPDPAPAKPRVQTGRLGAARSGHPRPLAFRSVLLSTSDFHRGRTSAVTASPLSPKHGPVVTPPI